MAAELNKPATLATQRCQHAWLQAPCIVFALRRESLFLRRQSQRLAALRAAPCPTEFRRLGDAIFLMAETGMGSGATDRFLDWLQSAPVVGDQPYRPALLLAAGFAGALDPALQVGDLLLATEVSDGSESLFRCTWPSIGMPLASVGTDLHRGRLLSVEAMISEPGAKLALGQRHAAMAVDMETASIARWCQRHELLFGAVRAVSDEQQTVLPAALARVLCGSRVSIARLTAALLIRPALVGNLYRLARDTRLAASRLGMALAELIRRSEPLPSCAAIRI